MEITDLPDEIIQQILFSLSFKEIVRLRRINKRFRKLGTDSQVRLFV